MNRSDILRIKMILNVTRKETQEKLDSLTDPMKAIHLTYRLEEQDQAITTINELIATMGESHE